MEREVEGQPGNGGCTADRRSGFHDFGCARATHGASGRRTVEGDETGIALEGHRTRQSGRDTGKKYPAEPCRTEGPEQAYRYVPFLRTDRCRKDAPGKRAGQEHVRHYRCHYPYRHERIHGEIHRVTSGWSSSGIRGLRRRRTTDREGAPSSLLYRTAG